MTNDIAVVDTDAMAEQRTTPRMPAISTDALPSSARPRRCWLIGCHLRPAPGPPAPEPGVARQPTSEPTVEHSPARSR